jgi:hypothetical protein
VNGFIDHLYIRPGTASNYSATANLHILKIITASPKPFSSLLFLHQPFPSKGSGDCSASRPQFLFSQLPVQK